MNMITGVTYFFGLLMLISAMGVVLSKKSLNSALSLVATMALVAVHFALMRADFIATLQVLIYAGAIMILVVFVIMLLGVERDAEKFSIGMPAYFGILCVLALVGLVVYSAGSGGTGVTVLETNPIIYTAKEFGRLLLVDYFLAFQIVGLLLLAAIIAAAMLAYSTKKPLMKGRGLQAVQDRLGVRE